ncbi:lipopolysaccharide assembly protein LapA domain-containing protein [Aliikangiella coralliicola]|uniref:LapA family protein n=1 Tax=Aliikangiella coralliicola TaxID=2592383 RepID=A0A545U521_9GAMM|nr:LapA family protein [Aliikangiella coralliicola]TQV84503.1 LapA family protein [Aliikangiella coralliicola]
MRNFITIILSLLLFVVSALFFAQNDSLVMINYFSGQLEWQLNWVMVLCLLVGFALGVASVIGNLFKTKFQLRQAKNKLEGCQKEVNNLRALPIKDEY